MTGPLKILHLEDDRQDARLVEATLIADGLAVEIRRVDTREAFEAALRSDPLDAILSDYNLPIFDGLEAQLLASRLRPDVPFIFLSGSIGEETAVERLKDGATDYVLKDRMARLPSAIRRALAEAAERAERRRADENVLRLNAELEDRVIQRTAQLATANDELKRAQREAERANRAKSDFLSRMSHDLRTPLNAILGFAQLLELDHPTDLTRESVGQIRSGGEHLLALIDEILDIARIEAGHLSLSPEPVQALEIATLAAALVQPLAARRGISLVIEQGGIGDEIVVLADRQRLNQILLNLLSNAVKYNREGGRVTVHFEAVAGRRLQIAVTDTGAGIPAGKLAQLFQPFERLGAEQTSIEGTGLGLALSRGLAEAMGGTLSVSSVIGRGSTFSIELALTEAPELRRERTPLRARTLSTAPPTASGTVLYIEDNRSNVRLMERVFERRPGVRLLHAPTGDDGLRLARAERPNLILLDLHLPDMSGEEVLRHLFEDEELRRIPVAMLSADATPAQARRLKAAGAHAYLTKPLDVSKLIGLIDDVLGAPSGGSTAMPSETVAESSTAARTAR